MTQEYNVHFKQFLKNEILGNKSEEKTCILKTWLGKDFLETILKIWAMKQKNLQARLQHN